MKQIEQGISDLLELIFPSLCLTCTQRLISQENYICYSCWHDLPATDFHKSKDNKVAQLFWGRVNIEHASSFFAYKKGSNYQEIIHSIKYKGLKELGAEIGKRFGYTLLESEIFSSVELIIPVPLHPKKERKRGYNQSYWIAKGLAQAMNKPISNKNLFRKIHTSTQTKKNRFQRWQNVDGIFGLKKPQEFEGKHILLIDDVVTTGSTLEACAHELLKITGTKVSIATLAFADM